jgi:hypothetical protein
MKLVIMLAVVLLSAACGDDGAAVDAMPIDAAVDAGIDGPPGRCGNDVFVTGEYIDWDSTLAMFDGVEFATWTSVDPPGRPAVTGAPNGRVELCIAPGAINQIDVTRPPEPPIAGYVPMRFVADPVVFQSPGGLFSMRGLKLGTEVAQFREFGVDYDASKAQVLVYKIGASIPLALGVGTSFVSDGDDDITWSEGTTGTLTLFPNRAVGNGTATLTSSGSFVGPTTLPLVAGKLTITVIR